MAMQQSISGQVVKLTSDKGFGFVKGDDGVEYFFHKSACRNFDAMKIGQGVTFEPGSGQKGPRTEHVEVA